MRRNENVSSPGLALRANIIQILSSPSLAPQSNNKDDSTIKKLKLCSICSMYLPLITFSNSQHRCKVRKCIACITNIAAAGATGCSLVCDHCMSNGLVDGKLHQAPGRKVQDRAIWCDPHDRTKAGELLLQFLSKFSVKDQTLNDIVSLGYDTESYLRSTSMTEIQPGTSIQSKFVNDFLTTICNPPVLHTKMSILPTTNTSHSYPMYAFNDAPTMTCGSILKFCNRVSESQYITSFPPNSVLCHPNGTVLLNSYGIMLGARCSQSLSSRTTSELMLCFNQMELHRPFFQGGKSTTVSNWVGSVWLWDRLVNLQQIMKLPLVKLNK